MEEKALTEKQSLDLITSMITKARTCYFDSGVAAIMWGFVIAVCSLVKFAEIQFDFSLPFDIYMLTFVAVIPQIFITIREKKTRKVVSYDDIAMDYVWLGFGICIFLLIHVNRGIFAGLNVLQEDYQALSGGRHSFLFYEYVSSLFLILYGLPTFITGGMTKFKPMFWGGLFCWACSVICVYTNVRIDLLLTAASAILAWLLPGLILRQDYIKAKRQLV